MLRWVAAILLGGIAIVFWWMLRDGVRDAPTGAGEAGTIPVPSGQPVSYLDTVQATPGPDGLTIRFRFLAPEISRDGGSVSAEAAQDDMAWLCENFALSRIPSTGPKPEQIVISFADRPVAFGDTSPEATQYFEAFSIEGDACQWEAF